jgi:membrane fusion protein (multidrug efflux system)
MASMSLEEMTYEPMSRAGTDDQRGLDRAERQAKSNAEAGAAQTPEIGAGATRTSRSRRRLILPLVAIGGLAAAGYFGVDWYQHGRFMVTTDDAYVRADMSTVAAKISGYVDSVAVADNTRVKAGDLLATIDAGDYQLAVNAARGKLETQSATIARIADQARAQDAIVDQARAGQQSAQAELRRASAEYDRSVNLARTGFATPQRLEQALADRDRAEAGQRSADATLDAAQRNLAVLGAQKIEAERLGDELRTALDRANRDLSFTQVRAPFDGIVGNRAVQPGQYVQAGTRLLALVPPETAYVEANFKETQLAGLKPGQRVTFTVDSLGGRTFDGTVDSVAPASGSQYSLLPPENATGNFTKIVQRVPVRIRTPQQVAAQGLLRPGLSVNVSVDTRDDAAADAASTQTVGVATR